MITVILSGGLGNQMFQFAAARSLSLKLNCRMSVDLYQLTKRSSAIHRDYQLDIFDADIQITGNWKVKLIVKTFPYLYNKSWGKKLLSRWKVFKNEYSYDKRFESLTDNTILFGYFQNEEYFREYKSQIRKDFTFKNELGGKNKDIAKKISEIESVSIHIRRTDYMSASSTLAVLDMAYYQQAINLIRQKVTNPFFFIFSDDIEWVRDNLNVGSLPHLFIDWNRGEESYIDMQLMSLCKHNITANSSFSWWGAWLNNNEKKIVIAPSMWYKNQVGVKDAEEFLADGWTMI